MTNVAILQEDQSDLVLASQALGGNRVAQAEISMRATPIARSASRRICKRYCGRNRYNYVCGVDSHWGRQGTDALRCDWGDFSYVFFLDEMAGSKALARYRADNGASLEGFWHGTLKHVGVGEKWKNERFGRRAYVPIAVKKLGPDAVRVFWRLLDGDRAGAIAQRFGWSHAIAHQYVLDIERVLLAEGLLNALVPINEILATDFTKPSDDDSTTSSHDLVIADYDLPSDELELRERVNQALQRLSGLERFVVTAMVIEELSAKAVLQALREQKESIKEDVAPEDLNVQHVYYYLYRCLDKLKIDCLV